MEPTVTDDARAAAAKGLATACYALYARLYRIQYGNSQA